MATAGSLIARLVLFFLLPSRDTSSFSPSDIFRMDACPIHKTGSERPWWPAAWIEMVGGRMYGWMDGWMDEWMGGLKWWVGGWMDG